MLQLVGQTVRDAKANPTVAGMMGLGAGTFCWFLLLGIGMGCLLASFRWALHLACNDWSHAKTLTTRAVRCSIRCRLHFRSAIFAPET